MGEADFGGIFVIITTREFGQNALLEWLAAEELGGKSNPFVASELIRLSIWADAREEPRASAEASATVTTFMLFPRS